jgi:hypothetical protein
LSIGYFGTVARHQSAVVDLNQAVYLSGASTQANTQSRRPNPDIRTLHEEVSPGNSSYNGSEISFRHRAKGGLSVNSNFNWSKVLMMHRRLQMCS